MDHFSDYNVKKSAESSTKFRLQGNTVFKKVHDNDVHMNVLSLYTKSIAFAPENSEESALGYGNRSALLFHIKKYKECIIDIDTALCISKSDKLRNKLSSRKTECLNLINKSSLKQTELVHMKNSNLPKMVRSNKVSCAAESLSLQYNEKYGRHMVANQDIKPGEIILLEEAYISFPLLSKLYLVCSHCLNQTWNGVPCQFCPVSIYCSENCKNKAWQEYHDVECSIISNTLPTAQVPHPLDQQVYKAGVRLFIKVIKNHSLKNIIEELNNPVDAKSFDGTFDCNQFKSCYNLADNLQFQEEGTMTKSFVSMSIKLLLQNKNIFTDEAKSYFESEEKMIAFAEKLLIKFISVISINSFTFNGLHDCQCVDHYFKTTNCERRGLIFTPCGSLFNHSCTPNAQGFCGENDKKILISIQPIRKGEQIFINYRSSIQIPKSERQFQLRDKYSFICDCQACTENWHPVTNFSCYTEEDAKIRQIISENETFCRRKGMRSLVLEDRETWDHSKKTLAQMVNLIELFYKKVKNEFNLFLLSSTYKDHMFEILWKFYGAKWENINNCSGTM